MTEHPAPDTAAKIGDLAAEAGIRRVHVLAWRDLDDVEAGGSEVHAANVCREWANAGLEVTCRTSFAADHPAEIVRDGYRVVRRAGRYLIFPRAIASQLSGRAGQRDALVEIWNGMPFFSPLWASGPRLTFLHHIHGEMWRMVLPDRLATMGEVMERRIAPLLYRRTQIVTLSESSRDQIVSEMHLRPGRVAVVAPGVDPIFRPGGERDADPLVVTVGRLVPSKHVETLVGSVAEARRAVPGLRLVVIGEGYERHRIEAAIDAADARGWVELTGHVSADALVGWYQRAWALVSASSHEGWGMSVTEAAACATPSVVTAIPGHLDAVDDGVTGRLVADGAEFASVLAATLTDRTGLERMGAAARAEAESLTWGATATRLMGLLAAQGRAHQGRVHRRASGR